MATITHDYAEPDGHFRRKPSAFRSAISADPTFPFPAEKDRYALYVHLGCPWAHRTNIVRSLKGLDDIIQLILLDDRVNEVWCFSGKPGFEKDPLYGFKSLKELYEKAEPGYTGRYLVPTLWDKKKETIVNNESSEIIRMFYTEFDALIPPELRESTKGPQGLFPQELRAEIEAMNEWVYDTSLDRLEEHLGQPGHHPYLFGENITEADIRLYPTIARFDVAYFTIFRCNLKMIRYEYPRLDQWLRRLYWDESERTNGGAFKKTTYFDEFRKGYASATKSPVIPVGPKPDILPL
ncbi:glutathione transferase [Clohesyomyces aquaticus]|uniref:Glutathione transferase n=1 Tax=Clohesyomyces aquaticus TaxID=1231657 RepID=A0A1Y1ZUY2_9PLEO|nr:glutathione transferase [Clohesyomyces aquaticus]